jgi:hypothetical protein
MKTPVKIPPKIEQQYKVTPARVRPDASTRSSVYH